MAGKVELGPCCVWFEGWLQRRTVLEPIAYGQVGHVRLYERGGSGK